MPSQIFHCAFPGALICCFKFPPSPPGLWQPRFSFTKFRSLIFSYPTIEASFAIDFSMLWAFISIIGCHLTALHFLALECMAICVTTMQFWADTHFLNCNGPTIHLLAPHKLPVLVGLHAEHTAPELWKRKAHTMSRHACSVRWDLTDTAASQLQLKWTSKALNLQLKWFCFYSRPNMWAYLTETTKEESWQAGV